MHIDRSMQSLRVAYFAGTMRREHDGVTRVLYRLIPYLNDRGIANMFFSPIVPAEDDSATEFFKIPSVAFPLYKDYRFALPGMRHFEKELHAFNPDVIHINSPCPLGYAAMRYGRKHRVPVVATYHTHFASYAKYYNVKLLEKSSWKYLRSLYNGCNRLFVPSRPIAEELSAHGIRGIEVLPHGVDTHVFNPQKKSLAWKSQLGAEGKHALLFAGRLVWEKDLRTLAETYNILATRRDDVAFILAGDGPIRAELQRMMPRAIFLGQLEKNDLAVAYASSDIFVFPSTTETFGNVTLEAMASGLPPVCAREGGAYGIIEHGRTGLLAEPRCPHDLAHHIESLLDSPETRQAIRNAGLSFAKQQQWDTIFDRMVHSYRSVLHTYSSITFNEDNESSAYYRPSLRPAH